MKKFGLIGFPLGHSFSKDFFTKKFLSENIHATYELYPIQDIAELPALIFNHQLCGFNVTIPHKERIIPYIDVMSDEATKVNAVNCVVVKNNLCYGYNTDVIGFEESLLKLPLKKNIKALVFGTGGASKAVQYVLTKNSIPFMVVSRNDIQNGITYYELNMEVLNSHQLLINTTPVGMYPDVENTLPLPFQYVNESHIAFDMIYNPETTLFLEYCKEQGAHIENGLAMLYRQAEESFELFLQ